MIKSLEQAIQNAFEGSQWSEYDFSSLVDNIVEKVTPKTSGLEKYIGLKHLDSGSLKIQRFGKTSEIEGDKLRIYSGDLIFAKRNSYLKRVSLCEENAVASAHALVLRPNVSNVDPTFLSFFMLSSIFWEKAIEISVGSLSPTINWKVLAKQKFCLPTLDVQQSTSTIFKSLDTTIRSQAVLLEKLNLTRKSLFKDQAEGQGWPSKKLKSFAKIVRGSSPRPAGSPEFFNGNFLPWVTVGLLTNNKSPYLRLDSVPSYLTEKGATKTRVIPEDTVILSNSGFSLGVPSILTFEAGANDGIAAFLELDGLVKEYLYYFLDSKTQYLRERIAAGADQPNLNTTRIGNIEIPTPPIDIQQEIVKEMIQLDELIEHAEQSLCASRELLKSSLDYVFDLKYQATV